MHDASSSSRDLWVAGVLIVAIAIADFTTTSFNFAILYLLPLLLLSRLQRPGLLWRWTIVLTVLSLLGYLDGQHFSIRNWRELLNYQMANRVMEIATLLLSAALLHIQIGLRELIDRRARLVQASDAEEQVFDQIIASFDRFATTLLCIVLIILVTLTDVLTPPQFNIPILFSLPLVASARIQQRWIIWVTVPMLVLLAGAGLYLGPRPVPLHLKDAMIVNRMIACLVLIGIAIILHGWIGSRARPTT